MSVVTLVCRCGMRMKAPGAIPGRVGKCPRCGSMLRVPDQPDEVIREEFVEPFAGHQTFIDLRGRKGPEPKTKSPGSDGFFKHPAIAETRWRDSLLYPLWNDAGVSLLAFMPVGLWFATVPLFALVPLFSRGPAFFLVGLVLLIPQSLLLLSVGGYTLLFLGQVLVTSSLGEAVQPRSLGWSLSDIVHGLGRWSWALVIGGVVGGLPSMIYWIHCGEVDWLDRIILVDLLIPGLAYAQMALLASLIFESPLAANPVTVIRAICRVGWAYAIPCVLTGSMLVVVGGLFEAVLLIGDPLLQSLGFWVFWIVVLYAAMVALRWLGLFCYRHTIVLDWFPERSRPAP